MAIMRAVLRRKLARTPSYSLAVAGYELDFLATYITYTDDLRKFSDKDKHIFPSLSCRSSKPADVFKWRVATPDQRITGRHTPCNKQEPNITKTKTVRKWSYHSGWSKLDHSDYAKATFRQATSSQLLRVRKRLGDLCAWDSKALEISIALVRSIEYFLNQTLSDGLKEQSSDIQWELHTMEPTDDSESLKGGSFTIPISRSEKNWTVDLGIVEAALSMWMANIEARGEAQRENPQKGTGNTDWRRSKSSVGTRYKYNRILGVDDNDNVLKRDLSWWVDDFRLYNDTQQGRPDTVGMDLTIGLYGIADGT